MEARRRCTVLFCLSLLLARGHQPARLRVDGSALLANSSSRLVSITMDWHLCALEQPTVPPADCDWHLASALRANLTRLAPLARALSPYGQGLLRIGGGPADSVVYDVGGHPRPVLRRTASSGPWLSSCPGPLCLSMDRWDELNLFARQSNLRLVLGLNALSANMTVGYLGKKGVRAGVRWDSANVRALLEYSRQRRFVEDGSLFGFELGNEIQGPVHDTPGAVHPGLSAQFHAEQFVELRGMIDEIWPEGGRPKLIGPDMNPCCSSWAELFLSNLQARPAVLDAFTFHNYDGHSADHAPGVLARELPTPEFLNRHVDKARTFHSLIRAAYSNASTVPELWLGEAASCAGSGVHGVSDAFESSLWYLDALGSMAAEGLAVLARQAIVGGYYELVDRQSWQPNPDYWVAYLWPRLMSAHALAVNITMPGNQTLRGYAMCGLYPSDVTLALINLSPDQTLQVELSGLSAAPSDQDRQQYHLTGGKLGLASRTTYMNGQPVAEDSSFAHPLLVNVSLPVEMPPSSIAFVDIPDAQAPACVALPPRSDHFGMGNRYIKT